jgi:NDP-sugar pyrophosphorylase family protein
MIGVVLAAGEASRLRNKPLLPISGERILIESAIGFLRRNNAEDIFVVVDGSGVLRRVLEMLDYDTLKYVLQPRPYGVPDAIARVAPLVQNRAIIAFCDNFYDESEQVTEYGGNWCSVRGSDQSGLDGWDKNGGKDRQGCWLDRSLVKPRMPKLAGWLVLEKGTMERGLPDTSLVEFLNEHDVKAHEVSRTYRWYDLGTPEAYLAYLKETNS